MPLHLKRIGFREKAMYRVKPHSAVKYAKQRLSFIVAAVSLFAFVVGNMVGQHGWYAFYKSVMGQGTVIEFNGTVTPIEYAIDYEAWAQYGGGKMFSYREAPESVRRTLPRYDSAELSKTRTGDISFAQRIYSTPWHASYNTQRVGDGVHGGVDIDVPKDTPVRTIANGLVVKAEQSSVGFGNHIVIKHFIPNTQKPDEVREVYSTYAHLNAVMVTVDQVVQKGELIGTVGNTGLVFGRTGYHLLFGVDTAEAPYHPYWPFTPEDLRRDKLTFVQAVNSTRYQSRLQQYSLSPMAFVQQYENYRPTTGVVAVQSSAATSGASSVTRTVASSSLASRTALRSASRLARARLATQAAIASRVDNVAIVATEGTATVNPVTGVSPPTAANNVASVEFVHDGVLGGAGQPVRIYARNTQGETVFSPSFTGKIYIRAAFGNPEIRPADITADTFTGGYATVYVTSRGKQSVVLEARGAFNAVSQPLVPIRD